MKSISNYVKFNLNNCDFHSTKGDNLSVTGNVLSIVLRKKLVTIKLKRSNFRHNTNISYQFKVGAFEVGAVLHA